MESINKETIAVWRYFKNAIKYYEEKTSLGIYYVLNSVRNKEEE